MIIIVYVEFPHLYCMDPLGIFRRLDGTVFDQEFWCILLSLQKSVLSRIRLFDIIWCMLLRAPENTSLEFGTHFFCQDESATIRGHDKNWRKENAGSFAAGKVQALKRACQNSFGEPSLVDLTFAEQLEPALQLHTHLHVCVFRYVSLMRNNLWHYGNSLANTTRTDM